VLSFEKRKNKKKGKHAQKTTQSSKMNECKKAQQGGHVMHAHKWKDDRQIS
jgi:hypothetical protein